MKKSRGHSFHQNVGKKLTVATIFFVLQEILMIVYPILLKNLVTEQIKNQNNTLPPLGDFLLNAGIVLFFLIAIFLISLYARNRVSVFGAQCRINARKKLYEKMTRVPTNLLYEFGTGKFLSILTYDTNLVKWRNEQYLQAIIYFCVTILGSCVLVLTLSPVYVLFILGAVAVEVLIVILYYQRKLARKMPASVAAYDKSFVATRESIAGARDIRILGKLPERTAEAAKQNALLTQEVYLIDHAKHSFESVNNIIFAIVTFGIVLFGAMSLDNAYIAEQLVIINTVIQYITIVTKAALDIFKMVINPLTRGKIAYQRIDNFLDLPEEDMDSGITNLETQYGSTLVLYRVNHHFWNGRQTIVDLSMELSQGKIIAVCGEAGGGKTTFVKILLRDIEHTQGVVLLNGVNIKEINKRYYRSKLISYCPTYPEFAPGTVRQNIQLFNPNVTDEQILAAFNEIGASHLALLPSFLDTPMSMRAKLPQSMKTMINIVRCILKPAEFYIFDRSFAHLPDEIVVNVLRKLRAEGKTCIFTTVNRKVCENSDEVFFSQSDHTFLKSTHQALFAEHADYAEFFLQPEHREANA